MYFLARPYLLCHLRKSKPYADDQFVKLESGGLVPLRGESLYLNDCLLFPNFVLLFVLNSSYNSLPKISLSRILIAYLILVRLFQFLTGSAESEEKATLVKGVRQILLSGFFR